jgi:hypothetical protein
MNGDKKLYLYSGLAIALAVVAYVIITKKKPLLDSTDTSTVEEEENTDVVSTTGELIDETQVTIPASLSEIFKKTPAEATRLLINKPLYTKLDNVKVRYSNYVNNGIINNEMSSITNRGFLLGNVIQVVDDKGNLKNNDGRVFKWLKMKPAQITLDEMNRNKGFLTHVFKPNTTGKEIYVREDTVKLEK